jgi:hypothetical protein
VADRDSRAQSRSALRRADYEAASGEVACACARTAKRLRADQRTASSESPRFSKNFSMSRTALRFSRAVATRGFRIAGGDVPLQILASVIDALHPVVEVEDVLRGATSDSAHKAKRLRNAPRA